MRFTTPGKPGDFRAHVIAGTRVILIALDLSQENAKGLAGFAFKREPSPGHSDWLTGLKVFKSLEPNPKPNAHYSTSENPIQSFLWSDYTASPTTTYKFTVAAMYGHPGALEPKETLRFDVTTEPADDGKHGIWFNRGSIASQAFAKEFDNAAMTDAIANDPDNKMTIWLSRGLLEASRPSVPIPGSKPAAITFCEAPTHSSSRAAASTQARPIPACRSIGFRRTKKAPS